CKMPDYAMFVKSKIIRYCLKHIYTAPAACRSGTQQRVPDLLRGMSIMTIKKILAPHKDQKLPVKIWTDDVDYETQAQLSRVANLPFVFKHVAAMPDVHLGKGATVGSVIATEKAIIPAAVGV